MHIMYFGQIYLLNCSFLYPFLIFAFSDFSGFHYVIFIHTYNVLRSYLPSIIVSFPLPPAWLFSSQNSPFYILMSYYYCCCCYNYYYYLGLDSTYARKHALFVFLNLAYQAQNDDQ
jgi:hypothetical protein